MVTIYEPHLFSKIEGKKSTWIIGWELGGCQGSQWRRKWQLTPVFLPGESYGQRSLAGYLSWGCKESDMTERLSTGLPKGEFKWAFPWIIQDLKARQRPSLQGVYGLEKDILDMSTMGSSNKLPVGTQTQGVHCVPGKYQWKESYTEKQACKFIYVCVCVCVCVHTQQQNYLQGNLDSSHLPFLS